MSFQSNLREIPYFQRASHKKMFLMNEFWFYSESLDSRDMCSRITPKEKVNEWEVKDKGTQKNISPATKTDGHHFLHGAASKTGCTTNLAE